MLALGDVAEAKKTLEGIEVCYSRSLGPLHPATRQTQGMRAVKLAAPPSSLPNMLN